MPTEAMVAATIAGAVLVFSILEYFAPLRTDRSHLLKHWLRNIFFALLTMSSFAGIVVFLINMAFEEALRFGLFHLFPAPVVIEVAVLTICIDLWYYWAHRLAHMHLAMWRFHRVHHSDHQVGASTAVRMHFGEFTWLMAGKVVISVLLGVHPLWIFVYDIISICLGAWYHSNLKISEGFDRLLSKVFVTQKWHLSHHSNTERFTNSNYALVLTIWDRIFGTMEEYPDTKNIDLGLDQLRGEEWQSVLGLWLTPFRKSKNSGG